MKTKLMLLLLSLLTISVNAQKKAILKFDKVANDYGKINEENGKALATFTFTNVGNDTLRVQEAKPSCGCISSDWTMTPIAPGQTGYVKALYNPYHMSGTFEKSIWVHSNAAIPDITLTLKGEVIPKVKTLQDSFPIVNGSIRMPGKGFFLRNIPNTQIKKDSMLIYNAGDAPLSLSFKDYPSFVTCKAKPTSIGPKQHAKILITYDATKKGEYGVVSDTITLVTNDATEPNKKISITATLMDDFSKLTETQRENAPKIVFTADNIDFGTAKSGEIVKRTFEFTNKGKDMLIIRKATPYRSDCKVTMDGSDHIATDQTGKITLEFNTATIVGDEKRTIMVTTNDPTRSFLILILKGKITQ